MSDESKKNGAADSREHVRAMLEEMQNVMLVTCSRGDDLSKAHARPMRIAKLDDDCTMSFLTATDSHKVDEAMRSNEGLVTGQTRTRFASIHGSFELTKDPALIKKVWSPLADAWFPNGMNDPSVGLLVFRPSDAEIWDSSGAKGVRYALAIAKAIVSGDKVGPTARDQHENVRLGH